MTTIKAIQAVCRMAEAESQDAESHLYDSASAMAAQLCLDAVRGDADIADQLALCAAYLIAASRAAQ